MAELNLTAAINKRKAEIAQLESLRPKIERLAGEARARLKGIPALPPDQWNELRWQVEGELFALGIETAWRLSSTVEQWAQVTAV